MLGPSDDRLVRCLPDAAPGASSEIDVLPLLVGGKFSLLSEISSIACKKIFEANPPTEIDRYVYKNNACEASGPRIGWEVACGGHDGGGRSGHH